MDLFHIIPIWSVAQISCRNGSHTRSSSYVFSGVSLLVERRMALKKCKFRPAPDALLSEDVIVPPLFLHLNCMSFPQRQPLSIKSPSLNSWEIHFPLLLLGQTELACCPLLAHNPFWFTVESCVSCFPIVTDWMVSPFTGHCRSFTHCFSFGLHQTPKSDTKKQITVLALEHSMASLGLLC